MHPDGEPVDVTGSIVKFKIDNYHRYFPQLSIVSVTRKGDKEFQRDVHCRPIILLSILILSDVLSGSI